MKAFATTIERDGDWIVGPWRSPKNMLAEQVYGGHASVHDDETARSLGFKAAAIEGPTHFSQFAPLACEVWGEQWLAEGGISAAYKSACFENENVRAFMRIPTGGERQVEIRLEREDGVHILNGTASIGSDTPPSIIEEKIAGLPPLDPYRVIFRNVVPGARRPRETVRLGIDDVMGALYPFSLRQKLQAITEPSPWYETSENPWGAPVIPIEMISILVHHVASSDPWLGQESTIDMFIDQEIRLFNGPLFVGEDYDIEREVIAISGSRRTESTWIRTNIHRPGESEVLARVLLNIASFKDSYPDYEAKRAAIISAAA